MDRSAARLIIDGEVQGVGFRVWVVREAWKLSLDGWARNRSDGTVEILAIGEEASLDKLQESCGHGPPGARVTDVKREPAQDDGSRGFAEWPTITV
jgi:acylphosphatase